MAKRIISGLLLTAFAIMMIALRYTILLSIVLAAFSCIATIELNNATKLQNKPVMVLSVIASAIVPFYYEYSDLLNGLPINLNAKYLICLYVLALFIFMLFEYEKTKFSHIATVIISSLAVPFAISRFMYFRDIDEFFPNADYTESHGIFFILFAAFGAWMTDVFAFFAGSFLGKHKLCPKISPKKTVEGAIGGVLGCVLASLILYAVFVNFVWKTESANYIAVALMSVFLSFISMCGDLTASVIKRNFEIKDFGKLIPGHGGVLDRFDSIIFVLTALYAVLNIFGVVI